MYEELIDLLRDYGRDCTGNDMCENCSIQYFCENGWTPSEIADAIEVLSKKKKTTQWIPVTERLPEDLTRVIVFCEDGVSFGLCEHLIADDEEVVEWHDFLYYPITPTHWMPLPEPPKEET